ncbi:multidrug ABC transporter ATP-binding protein [Sulfodiicoccus acidiphilus]|uniref:Multidrug ABC transporter ATP-binding protein n=1 Tax=Sulfodiicoccus acidiphilus TaxID=1670455 RepID=A0A830H449_9CREN|nr:multidrug ABC transporter ATP-binding protein [Sulfodiicoccus acidiphilus]
MTFRANAGEVTCVVGPNGAGKTTTLRVAAGIITNYQGEVMVAGTTPGKARTEGKVAYLPEEAYPYERLTGYENLQFYATLYARGDEERAAKMVERGALLSALGEALHRRTSEYSRGMKRRLLIARTLMTEAPLSILDEPTSGLDIESSVRVRRTIRDAPSSGGAVVLSSHNMLEVEYLCQRVVLINDGMVAVQGTPRELKEAFSTDDMEEVFLRASGGRSDS